MEIEVHSKPDLQPIVKSRVHKTCGTLQRYASRTIELLPDGWLYVFIDGMNAPQSKILVAGSTIADNSDSPLGFTILSANRDKKHKFICSDVDAKRVWIRYLHGVADIKPPTGLLSPGGGTGGNASPAPPGMLSPTTRGSASKVSARFVHIDRTGEPIVEDAVLKRSSMQKYEVRWFQVWKNVGLAYAKFRTSADDEFKLIPLEGARIVLNDDKLRIGVFPKNLDDPTYLRFDGVDKYQKWASILMLESGSDWEELSATVNESSIRHDEVKRLMDRHQVEEELDSDDELEIADLESENPVQNHKVVLMFESVMIQIAACVDSPGFDRVLAKTLERFHDGEGFISFLDQFETSLALPIFGPLSAIRGHIASLDEAARDIRHFLKDLLMAHPQELKIVTVAQRADEVLLIYIKVREILMVRRDIADFREMRGQHGLPLGVNATLAFVANVIRDADPKDAKPDEVDKAHKVVAALQKGLHEFRVDFDVFDDAYYTITEMENAIEQLSAWVAAAERAQREVVL